MKFLHFSYLFNVPMASSSKGFPFVQCLKGVTKLVSVYTNT